MLIYVLYSNIHQLRTRVDHLVCDRKCLVILFSIRWCFQHIQNLMIKVNMFYR